MPSVIRLDDQTFTVEELESRVAELEGYERRTNVQEQELDLYRKALTQSRRDRLAEAVARHEGGNRFQGERADPTRRESHDVPAGRTQLHSDAAGLLARSGRLLGDEMADRAARLVESDETSAAASWVLATASPEYAAAWRKVALNPTSGHQGFTTAEGEAWRRAEVLARSVNLAGGAAMVPMFIDPTINLESDGSLDPMREISRTVILTEGTTWHGVSSPGVTAEQQAESTEASDATPTINAPEVDTWKADAFVPITVEALADMTGIDAELRRLFVDAKAQHEAPLFVTGTGVGEPLGLMTGLTAAETVDTAAVGVFASGDVYALIEALPPRFRARATWLAALATLNAADQFESGNGAKKFAGLDAGQLLRRPVREHSEISDAITTTGEHILAVGDFFNFVIVDRAGFAVELVPHLLGANRRPSGERGFWAWWRFGGAPIVLNAFRRLEVA